METQLQLPTETRHSRTIVDRCEWRIRRFVEHDAYMPYDYWITTGDPQPDVVIRDHLAAINNAMRARAAIPLPAMSVASATGTDAGSPKASLCAVSHTGWGLRP